MSVGINALREQWQTTEMTRQAAREKEREKKTQTGGKEKHNTRRRRQGDKTRADTGRAGQGRGGEGRVGQESGTRSAGGGYNGDGVYLSSSAVAWCCDRSVRPAKGGHRHSSDSRVCSTEILRGSRSQRTFNGEDVSLQAYSKKLSEVCPRKAQPKNEEVLEDRPGVLVGGCMLSIGWRNIWGPSDSDSSTCPFTSGVHMLSCGSHERTSGRRPEPAWRRNKALKFLFARREKEETTRDETKEAGECVSEISRYRRVGPAPAKRS